MIKKYDFTKLSNSHTFSINNDYYYLSMSKQIAIYNFIQRYRQTCNNQVREVSCKMRGKKMTICSVTYFDNSKSITSKGGKVTFNKSEKKEVNCF